MKLRRRFPEALICGTQRTVIRSARTGSLTLAHFLGVAAIAMACYSDARRCAADCSDAALIANRVAAVGDFSAC